MASEQQLSDVLSEFARTMLTDFPIQGILEHLVERIVEILPISAAGVTLISPSTGPIYVAASDLIPEVNREPGARMALVVFLGVGLMFLLDRLVHLH